MLPPESVPGAGEQVTQLETALEKCQERLATFENAAVERLEVIEKGDALLRDQAEKIAALQQQSIELRLELQTGNAENTKLERASQETSRGMAELANRERTLTAENLELRNERLLHSISRRLRNLSS
jgi:transcriptional regulator NrdR family protein